jgi:hypothetical protein
MARRTLAQKHRGFHTGATVVPSPATPRSCPRCDDTPEGVQGKNGHLVLQTHLMEQHRPDARCPRAHGDRSEAGWKRDWDAVLHQQDRIWFCSECGFYAK